MVLFKSLHRGAFCQFTFRWIYYSHSSKSSGKETGKTRLFALVFKLYQKMNYAKIVSMISSYIFYTGNVPKPFWPNWRVLGQISTTQNSQITLKPNLAWIFLSVRAKLKKPKHNRRPCIIEMSPLMLIHKYCIWKKFITIFAFMTIMSFQILFCLELFSTITFEW